MSGWFGENFGKLAGLGEAISSLQGFCEVLRMCDRSSRLYLRNYISLHLSTVL
jgi:hypothetical protein